VICCGAKPLYFLDYISTQKIDDRVDEIMEGIIKGCWMSDMELIGGETAEHPRSSSIDLAGFCTGIVEEFDVVDGSIIKPGDKIIGIQSSGLHSNGYSLINNMLWKHQIFYKDTPELLEPTRIYAPTVKRLLDEIPVLGMAHITGGGLEENVSRCLPKGLKAHINWNSWPMPDIFSKVMLSGEISEEDMRSTFNMGIGFCIVVPPEVAEEAMILIDYPSQVIGICTT
jgi:phosphoribosylformylglycinamidine cyclo-ligase